MRWLPTLLALTLTACAGQRPPATPVTPEADAPAVGIADEDITRAPTPAAPGGEQEDAHAETEAPQHIVPEPPASQPPATFLPPPTRLVTFGDVHGDISALRAALSLALVIDADDRWRRCSKTIYQAPMLLLDRDKLKQYTSVTRATISCSSVRDLD